MRSFVTTLLALSLPLLILASHVDHHGRRHADMALRARGDILKKRDRCTFYDITTGQYVFFVLLTSSLRYFSPEQLVAEDIRLEIL
jgi:hypothetical protein